MKALNLLIIFTLLSSSHPIYAAKMNWVKLRKTKVGFKLPSNWNYYEQILGMPLVMLSPKKGDGRITVSVTNTGLKIKDAIEEKTLREQQNGWFIKRRKWLSNRNGTMLKTFPYTVNKWKNIKAKIHTVGIQYAFGEDKFNSYSYYFWCNETIFHAVSLYRLKEFPKGEESVQELLNSLRCKK